MFSVFWSGVRRVIDSDFWLYFMLVAVLATSLFAVKFTQPEGLFWDENYHIAAAKKYQEGVFFLEPHPPLGKLIIAASEQAFGLNTQLDTSNFVSTDKINAVPDGYSFFAVRLPGVLAAIGSVLLLFVIVFRLLNSGFLAFSVSGFLLFNNAFIVHSRAAMLESMQIFAILAFVLLWVISVQKIDGKRSLIGPWLLLGLLLGISLSIKVNSAILLIFLIILGIWQYANFVKNFLKSWIETTKISFLQRSVGALRLFLKVFFMFCASVCAATAVFVVVQGVHGMVAKTPHQGLFYSTPQEFRTQLQNATWLDFPLVALNTTQQWYSYQNMYQQGVPSFDWQKEGENGSLPWMWPVGGRAIAYRWGSFAENTQTASVLPTQDWKNLGSPQQYVPKAYYLYLVANPAIWFITLFSAICGIFVCIWRLHRTGFSFFYDSKNAVLVAMVAAYWGYLLAVSLISRVMYLYHYFVPLLFATLLWAVLLSFLLPLRSRLVYNGVYITVCVVVAAFVWFAPLTYFIPLDKFWFESRNWLSLWNMVWKG